LLVGKTGKGKSRIVEVLCHQRDLSSKRRTKSYTTEIKEYPSVSDPVFWVLDTPGFGDSEGRDGIFIRELYANLKKMTDGLVLVVYVKSSIDRLDEQEKKNIELLNEMFEDKLFLNFVVVLTNADLERDENDLLITINDHNTELQVPVIPFYGVGNLVEQSRANLLELFVKFLDREPLLTTSIIEVKTEQDKIKDLILQMNQTNDQYEKLQFELQIAQERIKEEKLIRQGEKEALSKYMEKKESGNFKGFTYLGKAIDSGLNFIGKANLNIVTWIISLFKKE